MIILLLLLLEKSAYKSIQMSKYILLSDQSVIQNWLSTYVIYITWITAFLYFLMAHKIFHHLHVKLHIIFAIFKYIFDILATNIHSNNFGLQKLPKDRFKRFCVREFILGREHTETSEVLKI